MPTQALIQLSLQPAYAQEKIIANVKENLRNRVNSEGQVYENGTHVFDEQLYQDRCIIEYTDAWIDGRFDGPIQGLASTVQIFP